jgi:hypothetical protein
MSHAGWLKPRSYSERSEVNTGVVPAPLRDVESRSVVWLLLPSLSCGYILPVTVCRHGCYMVTDRKPPATSCVLSGRFVIVNGSITSVLDLWGDT